jgi:hypothetical protein
MKKKSNELNGQALDNLLDALVWMRRKAKERGPVDALIDELLRMRRKVVRESKKVPAAKEIPVAKKRPAPGTRRKKKLKGTRRR